MRIHQCASCGAKFDVSTFPEGKKIRCARCKEIFVVPAAEAPPELPPDDAGGGVEEPEEAATKVRRKGGGERPAAAAARTVLPAGRSKAPAAEAPAPRAGRGTATQEASPRGKRGARAEVRPAGKGQPMGLIIAEVVGGLLVAGFVGFQLLGNNGTSGTTESNQKTIAAAASYDEAVQLTDAGKVDSILKLIDWCESKGQATQRDEWLEKAHALDAGHGGVQVKLQARAEEMARGLPDGDAEAHWKVAEWCARHGLKALAERRADHILDKIDKKHDGANKLKGNVLIEGEWVDGKLAADFIKDREEKAKRAAELAKMGPRGQEVLRKLEGIDATFGKGTYEYMDYGPKGSPYLLAIEKDQRVPAELRLEELGDVMTQLYKLYFSLYGEKYGLKEFDDAVLVIWIYASEANYRKSGAPPKAAAHFEPMTGRIVVNNELQDPYGVLFHEGIHQLVDYSTRARGGRRNNKFWFTEGVATYFEIFERRGANFLLGRTRPGQNPYLSTSKDLVRRERAMPLAEFIDLDYGAAQASNTTYSHYSQSWALTHFLNKFEDGKYLEKFEDYFKEEISGNGGPDTFKRIFGDLDALQKEWEEYILGLK